MACSESSYWLAKRAAVRSCSKLRKMASGRPASGPARRLPVLTYSSTPATVIPQQRRGLRCPEAKARRPVAGPAQHPTQTDEAGRRHSTEPHDSPTAGQGNASKYQGR